MCGRYDVNREEEVVFIRGVLQEIMEKMVESPLLPMFREGEIFPTAVAPVLLPGDDRLWTPTLMKWGFPNFKSSGVVINARQESLGEKPMFRNLLDQGRCVIPANGFYEWCDEGEEESPVQGPFGEGLFADVPPGEGGEPEVEVPIGLDARKKTKVKSKKVKRIKHFIGPEEGPLLMAGLWRTYRDPAVGLPYAAYTIVTTEAQGPVADIHDRMPLMLDDGTMEEWLDPGVPGDLARSIRGLSEVRVRRVG